MGKRKKDNNQHYKPFLCAALKQWMKTLQNWIGSKANKPSTKSVFLLKAAVNFQRIKTYLSITLWFLATISHLELSQLEKSRQGMLLSSIRCPDSGRLSGKTAGTSPGAISKWLLKYGQWTRASLIMAIACQSAVTSQFLYHDDSTTALLPVVVFPIFL